jgi:hypothetical protein
MTVETSNLTQGKYRDTARATLLPNFGCFSLILIGSIYGLQQSVSQTCVGLLALNASVTRLVNMTADVINKYN